MCHRPRRRQRGRPRPCRRRGLDSNAAYNFRLVATNADGQAVSAVETFTSVPGVALAQTRPPSDITLTSATLAGRINPYGLSTTYRFEFGTGTGYGSTVPVAPGVDGGQGRQAIGVTRSLEGLTPGTEYHYRLVATNAIGTSFGQGQVFTTLSTAPPPRGYEQVSPGDKAGGQVTFPALGRPGGDPRGPSARRSRWDRRDLHLLFADHVRRQWVASLLPIGAHRNRLGDATVVVGADGTAS